MATNKLLEILTKNGISQAKLARESGLNSGTINRYCRNTQQPSPVTKNLITNTINRLILKDAKKYDLPDIFPDN